MMKLNVYDISYGEDYECIMPVNEDDHSLLVFEGQSQANSWQPIKMELLKNDADLDPRRRRRLLKESDFPEYSGGTLLVLSQRAKDKIGPYLEQYGELLLLACDDGDFWALNVTSLVDALDEGNSQFLEGSDGRILMIDDLVFHPSKLVGVPPIFKLSQLPVAIYVMDSFVDMIKASGLKGLEFEKVWPND